MPETKHIIHLTVGSVFILLGAFIAGAVYFLLLPDKEAEGQTEKVCLRDGPLEKCTLNIQEGEHVYITYKNAIAFGQSAGTHLAILPPCQTKFLAFSVDPVRCHAEFDLFADLTPEHLPSEQTVLRLALNPDGINMNESLGQFMLRTTCPGADACPDFVIRRPSGFSILDEIFRFTTWAFGLSDGGIIGNYYQGNNDFLWKGLSDPNLLYMSAFNDKVGIGRYPDGLGITPEASDYKLEIGGKVYAEALTTETFGMGITPQSPCPNTEAPKKCLQHFGLMEND